MKKGTRVRRKKEHQEASWINKCRGLDPDGVFLTEEDEKFNVYNNEIKVNDSWWYTSYFDVVAETIEEELLRAFKLLGTEVSYYADEIRTQKVAGVELVSSSHYSPCHYSTMTIAELEKNDYVVVLRLTLGNIPLSAVIEKPTVLEVRLNSEYVAKVYKDEVIVGCQTIPFSVIQEIIEANKKL